MGLFVGMAVAPTTCASPEISFYSDEACTQDAVPVVADNTCRALPGGGSPAYYRYTALANATRTAVAATVAASGEITFERETMCCR